MTNEFNKERERKKQQDREQREEHFQAAVIVNLAMLYDTVLTLITAIEGNPELANELQQMHAEGKYAFPFPGEEDVQG